MAKNGRFIKKSTSEFYREGTSIEDYSFSDFLHGYLYLKWPYFYISVALGEHRLSKALVPMIMFLSSLFAPSRDGPEDFGMNWANSYHGKVVPLKEAKRLVSIKEDIQIKDLEKVIPFTKAKDIILRNPDRIAVLDCPCRLARENPCTPVDVCLIVGDPFASFILEHHPDKSRLISSEEAMGILQAEHERGHVSHAFFKDAMLNRFYAICNCCSCCCGAFQAQNTGTPMLMASGYTAYVDSDLCEGCGTCSEYCQFSAIEMVNGLAKIIQEDCYGCGVCVDKCDQGAVSLNLDPAKGEPLEIQTLMEEVMLAS
ncbi:MAG TPA: 4Fe-4S ferredoxin [Chloroflexi bacterium]|nr:MAG: 4Fe-4S ferredoxin [Chloroflexota bacterium]HDD54820.1 4Fe-4S ferredoxin [Chloroflexota bacterium]